MKSIDTGDGATMTELEIAQDIIGNRNDGRCSLNNYYSRKMALELIRLDEENKRLKRDYELFEELSPPDVPRREFVKWCYDAWERECEQRNEKGEGK